MRIKDEAFKRACIAQCLASKNLKNTGLFLIRNIQSSFDQETKKLKPDLNANQIEVLSFYNRTLENINQTRVEKNLIKDQKRQTLESALSAGFLSQTDFDEQVKACKHGKLFSMLNEFSEAKDMWSILDDSVLDQLMRTRVDQNQQTPFQALPAKASEQVRKQISAESKAGWIP